MEPEIRVGIVLPDDRMDWIFVRVPDAPCEIFAPGDTGDVVQSVKGKAAVEAGKVVFTSDRGLAGPAEVITIRPQRNAPVQAGAGIQLLGVRTGRGFHWEKRISPALTGTLEFRVYRGCLLVVNVLPLEDYLPCVIAGEMSGDCPLEFLKSQCVVARSWVLAHSEEKHREWPIDRCNDDCCQRYLGTNGLTPTAIEAARLTRGQVLLDPAGRLIDANYSKSCGGIIESPQNVWSVAKAGQRAAPDAPAGSAARRFFPLTEQNLDEYLTGAWLAATDVFCSPNVVPEEELPRYLSRVDEGGGHFRWKVAYDRKDLEHILKQKFFARLAPGRAAPLQTLTDLTAIRRGESGRVTDLKVQYLDAMNVEHCVHIETEYAIRDALHEKFLYSSAFKVEIQRAESGLPARITLIGAGWGHGAGMCQIGALGMALKGYDYVAILRHYFEGVSIFQPDERLPAAP